MPPDMKRAILANMNVKLYWWPLTFHKVVRQQIWREVKVLIPFSFTDPLRINGEKNYENWPTFVEVIARQSWPGNFDTSCRCGFLLFLFLFFLYYYYCCCCCCCCCCCIIYVSLKPANLSQVARVCWTVMSYVFTRWRRPMWEINLSQSIWSRPPIEFDQPARDVTSLTSL